MDVLQHDTGSVGIDTGQWRESSAIPSSFETGNSHVLFTRTQFESGPERVLRMSNAYCFDLTGFYFFKGWQFDGYLDLLKC